MIPSFKEGTEERKLLKARVKMLCAAQSRQIDKTKIGCEVKADIALWKQYQHYSDNDTPEQKAQKDFYNSILADRKPYFFRYKYQQLDKEYREYIKKINEDCELRFCMSLDSLKKIPKNILTKEQEQFIMLYEKYLPVIETDCVMNKICKYIEQKDFHIKQKVKTTEDFDWKILASEGFVLNKNLYAQISEKVFDIFTQWKIEDKNKKKKQIAKIGVSVDENFQSKEGRYLILKQELEDICSNEEQLTNHLVYLFYVDKPSYNKTILWYIVGKQIYETVKNKNKSFYMPIKNKNGSLEFLYEKYSIERIEFEDKNNDCEMQE